MIEAILTDLVYNKEFFATNDSYLYVSLINFVSFEGINYNSHLMF